MHASDSEFNNERIPLGYLITFRSYGTWLHGDERGSVDLRNYNRYGTPDMPENRKLLADEQRELRNPAVLLCSAQRSIVKSAIEEACDHRHYALHAVSVRTNHVHSVVSAACTPEHVMNSFKAYATRKLLQANLLSKGVRPWARHGSTPYLWTQEEVERAVAYVLYGQGDEPFS